MDIRVSERSLCINGAEDILYGGEFQYFRIPANLWEASLQQLAAAHVNFISCYIPWIWHMPEPGVLDFTGQSAPERDLQRLIELVEALDLALLVRPGPYVYGEYQGFGIPDWLRAQHPEVLILLENGQYSKEVSLNHPVFCAQVEVWLEAVFAFLKPWFDSGRIVACQIDNETGLPQFGGVALPGDFNPDTVARWQQHLQQRYQVIDHLNHVWGSLYADFDAIQPPSRQQGNSVQLRHWAEFIEDYLVSYLDWLQGVLRRHLPETFLYTNDPYLNQWPNQSPKKARLTTVGFDIYSKFSIDRQATHDVPFALSFAPEFYASLNPDRLLMGVEVGTGWFDPRVQVRKEATLQKSMIALLRGTRVIDYYLLHDCVEADGVPWIFQSPLDKDGQATPRYDVIQAVGAFVRDHGPRLVRSEPLQHSIGVLKYIPQGWEFLRANYTVFTAIDLMDSALAHFSGLTGLYGGLLEAGFNPIVHDLESIPLDLLLRLKVVFFASTPVMHREVYQKLLYYVEQGGTLVAFGLPVTHDIHGVPYAPNPLFPARPAGQPHKTQYGNNSTFSQITLDLMNYQVLRLNHPHRLSLHTLDMMQPFVEFTKYMGRTGAWLETDRDQPFWASRFVSCWQGGGVKPLLRTAAQEMVGYTRRIGRGRLSFLGTLPGLFFDTPAYYTLEPEKKQSVLNFLGALLRERGLTPLVEPIPHVETLLRQGPDGEMWVALINRGPDQAIDVHFNHPFSFQQLEEVFNPHPGKDYLEKGRFLSLKGHLSKDTVYVAVLSR